MHMGCTSMGSSAVEEQRIHHHVVVEEEDMVVLVVVLVLPFEVMSVLLVAKRPLVFGSRNLYRLVVVVDEGGRCTGFHDWMVVVETSQSDLFKF